MNISFWTMAGKLSKEREDLRWTQFGSKIVINTLTHPIEYAKVLMQIGHEPIAPRPTTTIFGKPALALPNLFQYIGYIKSVDGTRGCFRGLSAKLCANIVSCTAFQKVKENLSQIEEEELELDNVDPDIESACSSAYLESNCEWTITFGGDDTLVLVKQAFAREFLSDLAGHTVAVITSHPFQVIAVRMMAEFVGGEKKYSSIVSAVQEIYKENGLSGFFSGLFPRLIGDLLTVCITTSCTFLIHVYLTEDEEIRNYSNAIAGFFATAFTYPFHVVSNCMIVSSSGLTAGKPPYMPDYSSWLDCWQHLKSTNQIKRGSSLLWRYYTGPYVIINDKPVIVNKDEFLSAGQTRKH